MKHAPSLILLCLLGGCAGLNPNPGERSADVFWDRYEHQKALEIIRPRAEEGIPWAQLRLGVAYELGKGVEQDHEEALRWYKKVAVQNESGPWANGLTVGAVGRAGYFNQNSDAMVAQFQIANIYLKGEGVPKDLTKAYLWANHVFKASAGHDVFFCCEFSGGRYIMQVHIKETLEQTEREMTAEQREKARDLAARWQPNTDP
ncbi:Sel1 repeat family protein [Sulfidibacter corallicola]|uniref:Sel1 repeat family protein n=1 Tax=Sulfidibacter corallicola TaxID=2818388 RepID=A0A8A4TM21_SULCO|nr:tetratricopeptide repeat protein [Sulfidibacter corallicola]QTD50254.1 sel1 repeat family protein [Sulfidibacter corallicola]